MLPSEMAWLRHIVCECGLASYKAVEKSGVYHFQRAEMEEARSFDGRRFYLSPCPDGLAPISQTRPLISMWLPVIDGKNLCMATIGISKPWYETLFDMYQANLPIYRRLVRKIRKNCQLGMFSTNVSTGDRGWRPEIAVSPGVVANIGSFAALKPVLCDTFIEFTLPEHDPEQ